MRVWAQVACAAVLMGLLVPNGAAEVSCETTVVVERCSYDEEPERQWDDCSGNEAFGSCNRYMQNVSGDRYRVGGTWVFVGERHWDGNFTYWSNGFFSDCSEETSFTSRGHQRMIAAGSGDLSVTAQETESQQGHTGAAECPDGNRTQGSGRDEETRRVDLAYGKQARFTVEATHWEERERRTSPDGNETREDCGSYAQGGVYAAGHGVGHLHETGHCRAD